MLRIALPKGSLEKPTFELFADADLQISRDSTVIAYCTCPNEESSITVATTLSAKGYARAFALRGGFDAWIAAGYPVEEKAKAA